MAQTAPSNRSAASCRASPGASNGIDASRRPHPANPRYVGSGRSQSGSPPAMISAPVESDSVTSIPGASRNARASSRA